MEEYIGDIKSLLKSKSDALLEKIAENQKKLDPNTFESISKLNNLGSTSNQLTFLIESVALNDKAMFVNYIDWLKKHYRENKIPLTVIQTTLFAMRDAIGELFDEKIFQLVNENVGVVLEGFDAVSNEIETFIDLSKPQGDLAFEYNMSLLNGDRKTASDLVLKAVKDGIEIRDIYLNVFQISQYEVGRLWLDNKISVAKEHFCTAATQQIMSQLYPYIFSTERNGNVLVAANVGKELHEIGVRMVTDFFEMDGWDTYYLGANTPSSSIIEAIEENGARMVGLSIAMWFHLPYLKKVILELRERYDDSIKILVGGLAFQNSGDKWRELNADGYAKDAQGAIELANNILKL